MTTPKIKKELAKRGVIVYSIRKYKDNGYDVSYAFKIGENSVSVEKEIWVEEKEDLLSKFPEIEF